MLTAVHLALRHVVLTFRWKMRLHAAGLLRACHGFHHIVGKFRTGRTGVAASDAQKGMFTGADIQSIRQTFGLVCKADVFEQQHARAQNR